MTYEEFMKNMADAGITTIPVGEYERLKAAGEVLEAINTPELFDFQKAVVLEAQHQRIRWDSDHDAGKQPEDWFWLIGYLAGKALHSHKSGNIDKALHHTISTSAALANWHAAILGATNMRPGIDSTAIDAAMQPKPVKENQ